MHKSKFHGAFVLNIRVDLHAIDATPARWRGDFHTGADLTKASVRIYQNPPAACKPSDVKAYLERQNLVPAGSVCEIYLDAFEAFMAVDACDKSGVIFDLEKSTAADPRDVAVRITSPTLTTKETPRKPPRQCNMGPCGLFAFSLLMGLEATWLTYELRPKSGYVQDEVAAGQVNIPIAVCPHPSPYDNKELSRWGAAGRPRAPRPGCPPPCCRAGRSPATRGPGTPRATETPTCSAPANRRRGAARRPPP